MDTLSSARLLERLRFPLLALGLACLFFGVWAGLLRLGWDLPRGRANLLELHGPLMVFGFLGTVISLERAVALRRPWGYLAPTGTITGAALLFAGARQGIGELVLLLAGIVFACLLAVIVRGHATASAATLTLGGLLWVAGDALWLAGLPLVQVVPWWVGFLVLTIVGERLELAALAGLTAGGRAVFGVLTALLLGGLTLSVLAAGPGIRVAGIALVGYAVWLVRFDIVRRTIRRPGLPRFVALALLPGYLWLAVGGVLWLLHGAAVAGFTHDSELHAIFLGFVFSMIFGHAPVIFPGVLGIAIPLRRFFYLHLTLLHAGLALRIAGDLTGSLTAVRWGGLLNAAAIGLFLLATAASATLEKIQTRRRPVDNAAPRADTIILRARHMNAAPMRTRGPHVGRPAPFRLVSSYLVASLICWLIAAAALLRAAPDIARADFASPATLLALHLVALGFLPLAVTGAALHVLPTLLRASGNPHLGWAGLIGLCAGPFLALGISRHQPTLTWTAATLVGLGTCLIVLHVGLLLIHAPHNRLLLASRFGIASASVNAPLAFLLGPVLFVRQWQPWLGIPHERLIAIHLHLAAIGWLTLLIVTVGRTLVPMLALAPSEPPRRLPLAELSLIIGLWLTIAGFATGNRPLLLAGYATTVAALAHFATVLLRAARRNRLEAIEGPIAHVLTGFVCLCGAAILAGLLLGRSDNGGMLAAYTLLLLLGWAAGITLGHVGKLLSLSAWTWWPPGPRPKQAALYARELWMIEAAAFALGVQLLTIAALAANLALARAGGALLVVSALLALAGAAHTLRHGQPAGQSRTIPARRRSTHVG